MTCRGLCASYHTAPRFEIAPWARSITFHTFHGFYREERRPGGNLALDAGGHALPDSLPCKSSPFASNSILGNTNSLPNTCFPVLTRKGWIRSEEHTSELQSRRDLVCRLLLEKKKKIV